VGDNGNSVKEEKSKRNCTKTKERYNTSEGEVRKSKKYSGGQEGETQNGKGWWGWCGSNDDKISRLTERATSDMESHGRQKRSSQREGIGKEHKGDK